MKKKFKIGGIVLADFNEFTFIARLDSDNEYIETERERRLFCQAIHDAYMWGIKH